MNVVNKLSAVVGAFGVALMVISSPAIAENDITPSFGPVLPENWELRKSVKSSAVELTSRVEGGSLSTMCNEGACGVFVEPTAGCVPGR